MKHALEGWWTERSPLEKAAILTGAGALGVGIACAVVSHGLLVVTPKAVIAVGPVATTLAKSLIVGAAA